MKKYLQSIFVLTALAGSTLFTSCGDKKTTEDPETNPPTLTVNDGVKASYASLSADTISIKILASADTDRKIKKLTITRAITGQSTITLKTETYDAKDVIYTYFDLLKSGGATVDEADVITYTVTVEDDKGKTANGSITVTIASMVSSPQLLLGGPDNTSNEYRFFGVADGFRRYRAGASGADLARDNSAKIDFLYFYNSSGSVQNAIYSPDYAFTSGSGWFTEVSFWPTRNKTEMKVITDMTPSQFSSLEGSTFLAEIALVDFSSGTLDRIANLSVSQVLAFRKSDGKRGFILVSNPPTSSSGQILFQVKVEL